MIKIIKYYTLLLILIYINSINCTLDLSKYQGDVNVLEILGFKPQIEEKLNVFTRLQKNYNNRNARYWKNSSDIIILKSFTLECIFRIDYTIKRFLMSAKENRFRIFSLEDIENSKNVIEVGLKTVDGHINFYTMSKTFDEIKRDEYYLIKIYKLDPDEWYKLVVTYENGNVEYWVDCYRKETFAQIFPTELSVHYSKTQKAFNFNIGLSFSIDNQNIIQNDFGNFDIKKMMFYTGYFRPYETDCSERPT
ncbi:uncharacterized protein LOC129615592 [Condylostylus longicornis]|uniref:uncharacterized protein LOC129615592 n=1 Tax=Condylostylus longicornis TaxID=2530218 RepID=UPI00244DD274|nr:uncharacterized protein LOC129615592 [Condylostylus longicornis]